MKIRQNGFGLIEVMIAIAITGGLALTLAKLMDNTSQSTKQIEAKSETIYLKGNVSNILANQAACNFTFGPLITQANLATLSADPGNSIVVPNIKDKENQIVYSTSSTNIAPLRISGMRLTGYNSATGVGNLFVDMNFRRNSSTVQATKPISVTLNFNIDNTVPATPVLVSCSTSSVGGGGEWMLAGNSGSDPATNYIGTSDNQPLIFRVNALQAGMLTNNNVAFGRDGPPLTMTGNDNVSLGTSSLRSNTTGRSNVAIGRSALRNSTTSNFVVAIGDFALMSATGAGQTDNIAIGASALQNATTSTGNTAIGSASQRFNTTGNNNTSLGKFTLAANTTGVENVAIGLSTMGANTSGDNNIALGGHTLGSNTSGNNNVGIGKFALQGNSTGTDNVAIGGWAGIRALTGSNNIFLGSGSGPGDHMVGAPVITGSNNIFIGHQNGLPVNAATVSNMFYLTNPLGNGPLIKGDFSSGEINISRNGGNLYHGRYSPGGMFGATYVGRVVLSDSTTTVGAFATMPSDAFYARFANGYTFYTSSNLSTKVSVGAGGTAWSTTSDRNVKYDIKKVELEEHLNKVSKLPVFFWKYKGQDIPHMGPMAQDFWKIFGLGDGDDKSISTQDMDGVLIGAVKGLENRTSKLQAENLKLVKKVKSLEERISKLEELINK